MRNVESNEEAKNRALKKIKAISDTKGISIQAAFNLILRETKTLLKRYEDELGVQFDIVNF